MRELVVSVAPMKKLVILCVAAAGLIGLTPERAEAIEPTGGLATALPAVVHINQVVVVRHHRRYRTVRRVYYRHGRRIVVFRRVYY